MEIKRQAVIVTNVEVKLVPIDEKCVQVLYCEPPRELRPISTNSTDAVKFDTELVELRKYVRLIPNESHEIVNQELCRIGLTKRVQGILGIYVDESIEIRKRCEKLEFENNILYDTLQVIKNETFWKRLKWLFTGVKWK